MGDVIQWKPPSRLRGIRLATYARDLDATRGLTYEQKYGSFIELCKDGASGTFEAVVIAFPEVLGDSYEEMVANMSLAADSNLLIALAGPSLLLDDD